MNDQKDLVSYNFLFRDKLKKSPTYLIYNGFFTNVRNLIENLDGSTFDVDETDSWRTDEPNLYNRDGSANVKMVLPLIRHSNIVNVKNSTTQFTNHEPYFKKPKITGRTPLMLCSLIEDDSWSYGIAQNLIEKGASMRIKDSNEQNSLMYACLYERAKLLDLFLNAPSDYDLLSKDKYGNTAFHLASIGQNEQSCSILHQMCLKFNIDPRKKLVKNHEGHTPYDLCKLNGHTNCVKNLYNYLREESLSSGSATGVSNETLQEKQSLKNSANDESKLELPSEFSELNFTKRSSYSSARNELSVSINSSMDSSTKSRLKNFKNLGIKYSYRYLLKLKEPLIKQKNSYPKEPTKSSKLLNKPKLDTKANADFILKRPSSSQMQSKNFETNEEDIDSLTNLSKCWKDNVKMIFDTFELQNSKSYRQTNTNIVNNLFEQLSSGILLNVNLNQNIQGNHGNNNNTGFDSTSRRNSYLRKQNSSMSNNNDKRLSNSSSNKLSKASRRTSVILNT